MIAALLQRIGLQGLLILAAIGAVAAILFGAREAGRNAERVDAIKRQIKNVERRNEVEREIRRLPDGAARQRLRDKWSRD